MIRRRRPASPSFAGFRFPPDVIMLAVRWYLRYGLSYRDVEELLVERGVEVDHITIYRWVQRFTPLILEEARPCRHSVGDRWFVDETYVGVAGVWRYVYRAVDQHGQVIDVLVSNRRNIAAATSFFETMLIGRDRPREVTTDLAAPLLRVIDELLPDAQHDTTQYANNRIEWDHGRLKARLRPMRGLRTDRTATAVTGVMRSSRTYDAATTNSASKHAKSIYWSRQPSTNSPQQSELRTRQRAALSRPSIDQRNSALGDRPAIPPDHGVVDVGGVTGPAPADARTRSPKRWTVIDSDCSRT